MSRIFTLIQKPFFALVALFMLLALSALFPTYTHAQTTNDQEAQRLKASFQRLLDYQKNINEALGSVDVTYDGELTVTRQPTYYTLTFPHIYLSSKILPEATGEEATKPAKQVVDIGKITINAMADEKPGYWKIVLTIPENITVYDALKKSGDPDLFSLNIGEQRSIALYSEKLGYFTKLDMNMSKIDFLVGGQETGVNMGGIQFYTKLEEQDNGKFSGPGHFLMNNLHIDPPDQDAQVAIEELKLGFHVGDMVLPSIEEYQQRILKHKETINSLQSIENSKEGTEDISAQNVFDMLSDMYNFDVDSVSFDYSAKNISVKDTNSDEETKTIHIANGSFGAGASGLKSDKGSLNIDFDYEGFKTTPEIPEINDLVPQNFKINLEAGNVPYTTLSDLANNTFQSITQNPEAAQMAWLGVVMRLPAIISQAGTQIMVDQNNISNHIYDVTLDGKIATDLSSVTGFSAKFKLLFEGLEALLNVSQKHASKENTTNSDEYKKLIPTLEKLKQIGQPTTGKNDQPAYSYDIELDPQGSLTINGQDAQTVLGQQQPQQ